MNKKILSWCLLGALVFSLLPAPAMAAAARMYFYTPKQKYAVGEEFVVEVRVASGDIPINAVSNTVEFTADNLRASEASRVGSIVTLWSLEPKLSNADGTVSFEGALLDPGYAGTVGKVVFLKMRGIKAGLATLSFREGGLILANDGDGTNVLGGIDSLILQIGDVLPEAGAYLYEHINYGGAVHFVAGNVPDLGVTSLLRDRLSSLKLLSGTKITIYDEVNYHGRAEIFYSDDADLRDNVFGQDSAKSIKVEIMSADEVPVTAGDLLQGDGKAVYYFGADGRRHAFPNEKIYRSWFNDFGGVKKISKEKISELPLGKNVIYRPGTRLVKLASVPKVYVVSAGGVLHWLAAATVAEELYGAEWAKQVDDLNDAFFGDYSEGEPVAEAAQYNKYWQQYLATDIDIALGLRAPYVFAENIVCKNENDFAEFLILGYESVEVRSLQSLLQCLGYLSTDQATTGHFGTATEEAVKKFQAYHNIEPVGYVGPATRELLNTY